MRGAIAAVVLVALLAGATSAAPNAPTAGENVTGTDTAPRIVAAYPNPVADGDAGEFVALSVPPDTRLGRYRLGDDETMVNLPNATAEGRIVLSPDPNATAELVDGPVYPIGDVALANGGEPIRLSRGRETVDELAYADAPEGRLRVRETETGWRSLGATDRSIVTGGPGTVRAFVLPDAPGVPVEHLRRADRRVLLGAYTLTSERVASALRSALDRNVTVRILVDGSPVGGVSRRQADLLDRLERAGADVRATGGDYARYAFHHAKYAVVDDRALVTTENWKPSGTGGASSRGWGAVTGQPRVVSALAATFRADAEWRGAVPWERFRANRTFTPTNATTGSYSAQFDPTRVDVDQTRLLVAPDNAESAIVRHVDGASESLAVEQVSIGSRNSPFLQAALDAAERGVRVRILLSSAWYVREENRQLTRWLNDRASRENLSLEAELADPRGRFEKIHAKGVVVDGDQVILGSLNWNNNSARRNREVALVLDGPDAGAYFQRVFEADWPSPPRLPAGLLGAAALTAVGASLVARRIRFEPA